MSDAIPTMLRYWLHHDEDPAHISLCEHWVDRGDFEASMRADWREPYLRDT